MKEAASWHMRESEPRKKMLVNMKSHKGYPSGIGIVVKYSRAGSIYGGMLTLTTACWSYLSL